MTEAVGEDDVAAGVDHVHGGLVALLTLGNVGLQDVVILGQTQSSDGFLGAVDEVEVIGGVFIVQSDETDLHLFALGVSVVAIVTVGVVVTAAAGHQAQRHDQGEDQRKELLHSCFPPLNIYDVRLKVGIKFAARLNNGYAPAFTGV